MSGLPIVVKRDNSRVSFDTEKIQIALTKAFAAVEGTDKVESMHNRVGIILDMVLSKVSTKTMLTGIITIEEIQDIVVASLMNAMEVAVATNYIIYRNKQEEKRKKDTKLKELHVQTENGDEVFKLKHIKDRILAACEGLGNVDANEILNDVRKNIFDGIQEQQLDQLIILSTRQLIEIEPNYSYVCARLLMDNIVKEAGHELGIVIDSRKSLSEKYAEFLEASIKKAISLDLVDRRLAEFDFAKLGSALNYENDLNFQFLGLQTLYDRYFLYNADTNKRFELPQVMFMRVAMGLSLNESFREERAIEFYQMISSFRFMCSTPTLFNSGCLRPQLSSCYLTTLRDDLDDIFDSYRRNALLSKWAGGLGNDWTPIRAMNSRIKGTNGASQGVIPFLKIANDTAIAVNQGGKRKGAVCAYLEGWHLDIEDFIDLRKNTGDERRRTHDMNTAVWLNDLFMQRVMEGGDWTLFSPDDVHDLHDMYGEDFTTTYEKYERLASEGKIRNFKKISATTLWRKILSSLFETGHPWITFKDPSNLRSPQQHAGVVHSSNLCTEITLNTSESEVAVCNLGSVNLSAHIRDGKIDKELLEATIKTAIRMLDNVIDTNFYPIPEAKNSNLRHRPIGLGMMGFQDSLYQLDIAYASDKAVEFADRSMELISYYAIKYSCELAKERGSYSTFEGSLWSQGVLPIDSLSLLGKSRKKEYLNLNEDYTLDWARLRDEIQKYGIRNSNIMAIAPTATISNIVGCSQSIEPTYQNIFVKSNLSGEFVVVNSYLVADLQGLGLWDRAMIADVKYYNGSIQNISRIPQSIKDKYRTAFEIDMIWLSMSAARRQKWIDQSQSLNIYINEANGKKLDTIYKEIWKLGLKTTYYLRSLGATDVEKSNTNKLSKLVSTTKDEISQVKSESPKACSIENPECEVCQ